ncbi:PadR family transcriptional regulator [Acetobacter musti]|uniref:PadR family transcriptional regulator n=2 Tax=Acetobacter musti TaxID=864732 RepID=A0ABX0JMD3_9PROT|nr:PadR family transcriptional regulator [Acetobacter musti]
MRERGEGPSEGGRDDREGGERKRGGKGDPRGEGRGRHGGGGRGGHRLFDYGELRLLVLSMIAEQPRHGYELIRAIEEKFGGSYTPSPGVIYPTLSWLDDSGYANMVVDGDRKSYHITPEGQAFLTENRKAADEILSRSIPQGRKGRDNAPPPVIRAMENLKLAMRLRMRQGEIDQDTAGKIAAALDAAAQAIERS